MSLKNVISILIIIIISFSCKRQKEVVTINTKVAYVHDTAFATITEAINSLDHNKEDTLTIYIAAGVYEEYLKLHNRKLQLIGAGKDNTFIIGRKGDYYQPAAEFSGNIYVTNITFKEMADSVSMPAPNLPAYAVHLDFPGTGTMHFYNCNFESNSHSPLGIGLQNQQTLILEQCSLIGTNPINNAMYLHNSPYPAANTNQKFIAKNCTFISNNYYGLVIKLGDAAWYWQDNNYIDSNTKFTFINNVFISSANKPADVHLQPPPFNERSITGNVTLDTVSNNNSILKLNAK